MRQFFISYALWAAFLGYAQERQDTIKQERIPPQRNLFQQFTGGLNTVMNQNQMNGGFDLAVQTYHYFFITGRRFKNDSIHQLMLKKSKSLRDVYRGFHFFLLNRAAIDLDTLRAIANNYITSLQASPLTFRMRKEVFLTKAHEITSSSLTPVLSLLFTTDARAIPYGDVSNKVNIGASGHLFCSISARFKRVEFSKTGKEIDKGTMYFRPTFGIAYGSDQLMKSIMPREKLKPILTSGCRLGFRSEKNQMKDFSFLFQYTISQVIGPKLRAGIVLTSL